MLLLLMVLWEPTATNAVMFPHKAAEEQTSSCLKGSDPLIPCVVSGAVAWVEATGGHGISLSDDLMLLDDFHSDEEHHEGDPRESETLLASMERRLAHRRLIWSMNWLYPGLVLVVGAGPEARMYFTVDPRAALWDGDLTTGRLLVKRTVLPVLLGVNLKVAAIAPFLIGGMILLAKKALILSKLALILSGLSWYQQYSGGSPGGLFNSWRPQNFGHSLGPKSKYHQHGSYPEPWLHKEERNIPTDNGTEPFL